MSGRSARKAALQAQMRATPNFGPLPVVADNANAPKRSGTVAARRTAALQGRAIPSRKTTAVTKPKPAVSSDSESESELAAQTEYIGENLNSVELSHRALPRTLKPKKGKSRSRKGSSNPSAKGAVLLSSNDPDVRRYFRTAVAAQDYLGLDKKGIWFAHRYDNSLSSQWRASCRTPPPFFTRFPANFQKQSASFLLRRVLYHEFWQFVALVRLL